MQNEFFNTKNGQNIFNTVSADFATYLNYIHAQVAEVKQHTTLENLKKIVADAPYKTESAIIRYHVLRLATLLPTEGCNTGIKWAKESIFPDMQTAFHAMPIDCQVYFASNTQNTKAGKDGALLEEVQKIEKQESELYLGHITPILESGYACFNNPNDPYPEATASGYMMDGLKRFKAANKRKGEIITPAISDYVLLEALALTAIPKTIMQGIKDNAHMLPLDQRVLSLEQASNILLHKNNVKLQENIDETLTPQRIKYNQLLNKYKIT